jgi:pyruvate/2-oxoglutarate/acetoin dehydrogenase E1 component
MHLRPRSSSFYFFLLHYYYYYLKQMNCIQSQIEKIEKLTLIKLDEETIFQKINSTTRIEILELELYQK